MFDFHDYERKCYNRIQSTLIFLLSAMKVNWECMTPIPVVPFLDGPGV